VTATGKNSTAPDPGESRSSVDSGRRAAQLAVATQIGSANTANQAVHSIVGQISSATADSLLRDFFLACVVGTVDAFRGRSSSSFAVTSEVPEQVALLSRLAELKAWLEGFDGIDVHEEGAVKIEKFAAWQMENNFSNFSRSIQELAPIAADTQVDALAQLLIASSDHAHSQRAFLLGASIEPYLENNEPLLIDAAAKALSRSRLDFKHAAKRIASIGKKTRYRYLKRQLEKVARQLGEGEDAAISPQA
jgi:hypothetical protein